MKSLESCRIALLGAALATCFCASSSSAQTYTLVQGLDKFDGSTAAWHLLGKNGFVVADPSFKEMSDPYVSDSLPFFITTDSAWHAYQVLLGEGTRALEKAQSPKLADFSRLLRRLPEVEALQNYADPKVPGRKFPSGLDFFVASPALRSPAAERALRAKDGDAVFEAVRKVEAGPLPDSLRGRALGLLAILQSPLPVRVGPAMRCDAWADAQLWSQLGDWAEAEHAESSQGAANVERGGGGEKLPAGKVAPYPDFFSGLGQLALDTAVVLEKAGLDETFDPKTTARKLLECVQWQENLGNKTPPEMERMAGPMAQFNQFVIHHFQPHQDEDARNPAIALKMVKDLEELAQRCSTQTAPAEADRQVLLNFFQERQSVPKLLRDFAPFCDKLAELARKHLEGVELTEDDTKWMGDYGPKLARFLNHSGGPAEASGDDVPIVNRLYADSERKEVLYAGLGRPQALYIILPSEGRLRLYRGAVLTYREFVRTNAAPLDDASWRSLATTGEAPPPPAFVHAFQAERDSAELIKSFAAFNADSEGYKEVTEAVEELQSRVTDRDVPALIAALDKTQDGLWEPVAGGLASAIGKLHWEPHQRELFALLEKDDGDTARMIAPILMQRPEGLDADFLCTNFQRAPVRARRIYCALLSRVPQTEQTSETLLRALSDTAPSVRLEAATVVDAGHDHDHAAASTDALLARLNDENEYVAAAAAAALARVKETNAAPALLAKLEERLQKPEPTLEDLRKQNEAVRDFPLNFVSGPARAREEPEPPLNIMRMPRMGGGPGFRPNESPVASAIIEAMGELHYHPAEERIFALLDGPHATSAGKALKQLAPEKLTRHLVSLACDKKADASARDRALQMLTPPPAGASTTELVPLLNDMTIVPGRRPMAGRDWRICDRAAETISTLLGRPLRIQPGVPTEQRDLQIEQVRQSLKASY